MKRAGAWSFGYLLLLLSLSPLVPSVPFPMLAVLSCEQLPLHFLISSLLLATVLLNNWASHQGLRVQYESLRFIPLVKIGIFAKLRMWAKVLDV